MPPSLSPYTDSRTLVLHRRSQLSTRSLSTSYGVTWFVSVAGMTTIRQPSQSGGPSGKTPPWASPTQPAYPPAGSGAPQLPPGMYFDPLSQLILPNGTQIASVGMGVGAAFLAIPLSIVITELVSFILFLSTKGHRSLHDMAARSPSQAGSETAASP